MLLNKKIILGTEKKPLMILEKHSINKNDFNFEKAKQELQKYEKEKAENQCTWGYFPQLNPNPKEYPESIKLSEQIKNNLLKEKINWQLAFIRVASKEPKSEYGGMHIDVDVGIMHKRDEKTKHKKILRALINSHTHSRKVNYSYLTIDQLKEKEIEVGKENYQILNLPKKYIRTIEIPPIESNAIYMLKFISSQVPHAGITNENGHFLIAYGAYLV